MEKSEVNMGLAFPVMEHFYTIQGEGYYQGRAAYFVRLGGCDVGCLWCDVKESWDAAAHPIMTVDEIISEVQNAGAKMCVITGGEPAMYDLSEITRALHAVGVATNIETSGAYKIRGEFDWICVSPKRFKLPLDESLKMAHELKVIMYHKNDTRFAEEYAAKVSNKCKLYLQPEWSNEEEMVPLIIDYVKQHPEWEVSLQIHKYMNIP